MTHILEADIMYFSYAGTIPCAEIAHIVVNEKVVGLNIFRPTIFFVIHATEPFAVNNHTGD